MLKITYNAEPFYCEHTALNDSFTRELTTTFQEDTTFTEILAEVINVLIYAGYHKPSYKTMLDWIDTFAWEGIIDDDREEEVEMLD